VHFITIPYFPKDRYLYYTYHYQLSQVRKQFWVHILKVHITVYSDSAEQKKAKRVRAESSSDHFCLLYIKIKLKLDFERNI